MFRVTFACLVASLSIAATSCGSISAPPDAGNTPGKEGEQIGNARPGQEKNVVRQNSMTPAQRLTADKSLVEGIEAVAARADGNFEDGWICNRNARVLKSGYARVAPKIKAQFAMDYRKMLEAQGENLASDINTYVPYKTRAKFALSYWRDSEYGKAFEAETKKKQVQWIYESMLDAGELFWRAYEILHPEQVNSAAVLAHYKEQDMVFNYMEDEKTAGSFSDQYVNWVDDKKAESDK